MLATRTPHPSDCVILATQLARSDLQPVSRQQLTTECHTASSARTKTLSESAVAAVSHLGPVELAVPSSVTESYHRVINGDSLEVRRPFRLLFHLLGQERLIFRSCCLKCPKAIRQWELRSKGGLDIRNITAIGRRVRRCLCCFLLDMPHRW